MADALDLKFSDESDDLAEEGMTGPERTYRGPHINFPMQRKDLDIIIDLFRKKKVRQIDNLKWIWDDILNVNKIKD